MQSNINSKHFDGKVKGEQYSRIQAYYLRISSSICSCLAGFGIASEISTQADPSKVIAVWLTSHALVGLAFRYVAKIRRSPTGYKHPLWTELAKVYASKLGIRPREVWVIEDHQESFIARAEPDRIVVHKREASQMSDRSMEFIIAHEVAHYYPIERPWVANVVDLILKFAAVAFCALVAWWAIPLVALSFGLPSHMLKNMLYRLREHQTDLLAMQITSHELAFDAYYAHEESGIWRFFKQSPSFNARRNYLLKHLDHRLDPESDNATLG